MHQESKKRQGHRPKRVCRSGGSQQQTCNRKPGLLSQTAADYRAHVWDHETAYGLYPYQHEGERKNTWGSRPDVHDIQPDAVLYDPECPGIDKCIEKELFWFIFGYKTAICATFTLPGKNDGSHHP